MAQKIRKRQVSSVALPSFRFSLLNRLQRKKKIFSQSVVLLYRRENLLLEELVGKVLQQAVHSCAAVFSNVAAFCDADRILIDLDASFSP